VTIYGQRYRETAEAIKKTIVAKYWDAQRGLFADTRDRRNYSQHVNAMAILAGIVEGDEARQVMTRTLQDETPTQATIYFRCYLNQALRKAELGDRLLDNMQVWDDRLALGLSTWAEPPEPSRSDCHAWEASPDIELFRTLLGIDSDAPGLSSVRIAPSLGELKDVSGSIPHPRGDVSVRYHIGKRGELHADISLPETVSGIFEWRGKRYDLRGRKPDAHSEIILRTPGRPASRPHPDRNAACSHFRATTKTIVDVFHREKRKLSFHAENVVRRTITNRNGEFERKS